MYSIVYIIIITCKPRKSCIDYNQYNCSMSLKKSFDFVEGIYRIWTL